jgi:hypothetical protein
LVQISERAGFTKKPPAGEPAVELGSRSKGGFPDRRRVTRKVLTKR